MILYEELFYEKLAGCGKKGLRASAALKIGKFLKLLVKKEKTSYKSSKLLKQIHLHKVAGKPEWFDAT